MAGEEEERILGEYLLALLRPQGPAEHWIHRRVESVSFVGLDRVRRQMSVDFEIPKGALRLAPASPIVPLTLLDKGSLLTDFDLYDEAGQAVPLCTAGFTSEATRALLLTVARRCGAPDELLAIVGRIGAVMSKEGIAAYGDYLDWRAGDGHDLLPEHLGSFETLMDDLASRFLLLAQPAGELDRRRLLKLRYEITGAGSSPQALPALNPARYGLRSTPLAVAVSFPVVTACRSYHLEVEAPQGTRPWDVRFETVRVTNGELYRQRSPRASPHARITGSVAHIQGTLLIDARQVRYWESAPLQFSGRIRERLARRRPAVHRYLASASSLAWRPASAADGWVGRRRRGRHRPAEMARDLAWGLVELVLAVLTGAFALAALTLSGSAVIRVLGRYLYRPRSVHRRPSLDVVVRLYPDPQGLPAAGAMTALFAAGVLAAGAWNQVRLFPPSGGDNGLAATAATVLLAVSAAFAGIAARPMHSVTAKQYLPLRLLLLLVSGASIVAAASLLLWPPGAPPRWLWWTLTAVSGGIMVMFLAALLLASARSRQPRSIL